jgi:multiple sugar transport system substrate-binding protein
MASIVLRGMTWEHRRAVDPLLATMPAFRATHPDVDIQWFSRSLHGFEFTSIEKLAGEFDLIVLDHPFVGEIASSRCLEPLDSLIDAELRSAFVGPSLDTYRWEGHVWAMPVDAACQVAVSRPDLMRSLGRNAPATWNELYRLGDEARRKGMALAIGLKGVHSLMTFFTLCANLGRPCAVHPSEPLFDPGVARRALAALRELIGYCPPEVLDWNSIALHDEMAGRDDLVFCPAVYCYATYAERDVRRPLRFHDLPGLGEATCRGSTIGGTGIGLSARCRHRSAALDYLRFVSDERIQRAFAENHGQPARCEAWMDSHINERLGGTYRNTLKTMEQCWIRPRYAGYLSFQAKGGDVIERHLRGVASEADTLSELSILFHEGNAVVGE